MNFDLITTIFYNLAALVGGLFLIVAVAEYVKESIQRGILRRKNPRGWQVVVDKGPISHRFPDVGADGDITIDCVVSPTRSAYDKHFLLDQLANDGVPMVAAQRVGSLNVEIDQYGLCLRWESAKVSDELLRSVFVNPVNVEPGDHGAAS